MKTTVADKPLMHTIKISPGLSSSGDLGAVSLAVQPRILFRVVLGAVLRARRQESGRTLREVSREAQVSLGYLSEIERGQKEASSELLAAVCRALGLSQSEIFSDVVTQMALSEMASAFVSVPSN